MLGREAFLSIKVCACTLDKLSYNRKSCAFFIFQKVLLHRQISLMEKHKKRHQNLVFIMLLAIHINDYWIPNFIWPKSQRSKSFTSLFLTFTVYLILPDSYVMVIRRTRVHKRHTSLDYSTTHPSLKLLALISKVPKSNLRVYRRKRSTNIKWNLFEIWANNNETQNVGWCPFSQATENSSTASRFLSSSKQKKFTKIGWNLLDL